MKANTAPSGVGFGDDRRDLVDHVVQLGNRIVPGRPRIDVALEPVGAPEQQDDADDDPGQQREPHLRAASASGRGGFGGGAACRADSSLRAQRRREPELLRLPDFQEADQAGHRDQRRADIDDPGIDEVRDQELRDRERDAGDQDRGPDSFMPFQPAKAQISQNGTISEKNGNCRPTMAPSRNGSMPVTLAQARRSACRARRRRPAPCWRSATGRRPRAARSRARSGSRR